MDIFTTVVELLLSTILVIITAVAVTVAIKSLETAREIPLKINENERKERIDRAEKIGTSYLLVLKTEVESLLRNAQEAEKSIEKILQNTVHESGEERALTPYSIPYLHFLQQAGSVLRGGEWISHVPPKSSTALAMLLDALNYASFAFVPDVLESKGNKKAVSPILVKQMRTAVRLVQKCANNALEIIEKDFQKIVSEH